jgi:hypothetical protein
MSLRDRVDAVSLHRETRDEVIEYFQGEFGDDWKGELSDKLGSVIEDLWGKSMKHANIMRRFQNRGGKDWTTTRPSAKQREEYRAVGAELPVMPPENGYVVDGVLFIRYSQTCERRELPEPIYITGEDAELFAQTADVQIVINLYNEMDADDPEGYSSCDEPDLTVDAA